MDIQGMYEEIRSFCQQNTDPLRIQKYARYFVEGYDAYGVDPVLMEQQRNAWLQEFRKELDFEGFLQLGDLLVQSGKYEEAFCAMWFANQFTSDFKPETLERLGGWMDGSLRNWAHTDSFSLDTLAQFLTRGIVSLDAFSNWRSVSSKWKRRSVPVTLIKALKTGLPVSQLLEFLAPMMLDTEKVVHQGLGWFLREAWKLDPAPVETFLLRWKDSCARLIVQYATEKMTPGQKVRFKKSK